MDMFQDVKLFTHSMSLPTAHEATLLPREVMTLRLVYMLEELAEFGQCHRAGDLPGSADALVDLVYFALGTAVQMGLPWNDIWNIVHRANMNKRPGYDKYGNLAGVVKPDGWMSPHDAIVNIVLDAAEQRA